MESGDAKDVPKLPTGEVMIGDVALETGLNVCCGADDCLSSKSIVRPTDPDPFRPISYARPLHSSSLSELVMIPAPTLTPETTGVIPYSSNSFADAVVAEVERLPRVAFGGASDRPGSTTCGGGTLCFRGVSCTSPEEEDGNMCPVAWACDDRADVDSDMADMDSDSPAVDDQFWSVGPARSGMGTAVPEAAADPLAASLLLSSARSTSSSRSANARRVSFNARIQASISAAVLART
jgi:hypothetical protein